MKYTSYSYPFSRVELSVFITDNGLKEYHTMIHATNYRQSYQEQKDAVLDAYNTLLKKELLEVSNELHEVSHGFYPRDMTDYLVVKEMFDQRFPDVPRVLTWDPICRSGWLIEMECMAMKK